MLRWALVFLAIALAASAVGFDRGLDADAMGAAKLLFFAALALFVFCVGVGAKLFGKAN